MTPAGAIFNYDRKYRYVLWRKWNENPSIMFIGLNPSEADENKNDRTMNRVVSFAAKWGYGSVFMLNLFPFVTSKPSILKREIEAKTLTDAIIQNDTYLSEYLEKCERVICAWGAYDAPDRVNTVLEMIPSEKRFALLLNNDGSPRHPLYVKGDTIPQPLQLSISILNAPKPEFKP